MTQLEVLFRYATPPNERVAMAIARIRDVYGIRQVTLDTAARTVRVEFDATRLNAAAVGRLLQAAGLDLAEELPLIAPPPEPAAA
jgi:copper chaperone CopZ